MSKETISIKDENGKEYVFEKPEFECELLKVINEKVIGTIKIKDLDKNIHTTLFYWFLECGTIRKFDNFNFINQDRQYTEDTYNLTPIKPKWYETDFKLKLVMVDENELMLASEYDSKCFTVRPLYDTESSVFVSEERVRPATKEELLSLYVEQDNE